MLASVRSELLVAIEAMVLQFGSDLEFLAEHTPV